MNAIAALILSNKLAAGLAVAALATSATVGTFAAQGKLPGQANGVFFSSASATPHATEVASKTEQPESSATARAVKGIPTSNGHFTPETDGTCVAGESVVKTTTAGTQVNVPCQAAAQGNNGNAASSQGAAAATVASGNSDRTPGPSNQPDGGLPTAVPSAASGHVPTVTVPTVTVPTPHSR